VLILPSSMIFAVGFKTKGWCTEHIQTCVNKANRSLVCKSQGKRKNGSCVQVTEEIFRVNFFSIILTGNEIKLQQGNKYNFYN
jgi:hypothetical protein